VHRESEAPVTRFLRLLRRRVAVGMALAAAFAFVLDGSLALDRHLGNTDERAYHGAHVHFHLPGPGPGPGSDHAHPHHHGDASGHHHSHHHGDGDVTGHDHGDASGPHADGGGSPCAFASCHIGVMLLCLGLSVDALPLQLDLAKPPPEPGDGFEPAGPRKPPRPRALA
jgi:hypothetical protein